MPHKSISKNLNFFPVLILSQIFLILSLFYLIYAFFTLLFNELFSLNLHIDQMLSGNNMDFESQYGVPNLIAYFFTNLLMIAVYIILVENPKQIVDYTLTNFFFHFIFTSLNSHIPLNLSWLLINIIFLIIVTLIAEYISLRKRQRPIGLSFLDKPKKEVKAI
jgi:hypothetical protein